MWIESLQICNFYFISAKRKISKLFSILSFKSIVICNFLLNLSQQKDLKAVLDYMYNGEVSIAQDSLNSFLSAAEELAVKGLTANDSSAATTNLTAAPASPVEEVPVSSSLYLFA